ncbi:MAG: YkgJ family cysteine cluster protein [Candidatus Hydrothermarchaeales archaeon]
MLIYSAPLERWECVYKKCGAQCCIGGREVTAGDIRRISQATGYEPEVFTELNEEKGLFKLKSKGDKCFFLRDDYACELHGPDAEPILCRMYPFKFDGIIYSDEIVLRVKAVEDCPGFGCGEQLEERFEAGMEELGNKFVREIKDYLKLKHEGLSIKEILKVK